MARQSFVVGDTPEAKFGAIDNVLRRLASRSQLYATVAVPQIPIFIATLNVGEDGIIGRILIPVDGTIVRAMMHVESVVEKVKPVLTITTYYPGGSRTEELVYKAGTNLMDKRIDVVAGTRVVLSTSDAISVSGISVGLVFEVTTKSLVKEQVALERVFSALEAKDASKTEEGEAA